MKEALNPGELRVLAQLAGHTGPVAEQRFEAEALRSLEQRGMVRRLGGFVLISPAGRAAVLKGPGGSPGGPAASARPPQAAPRPLFPEPSPAPDPRAEPPATSSPGASAGTPPESEGAAPAAKVNSLQEDLLRRLVLEGSSVPVDDVDGRVIRALEGRGLVRRANGQVEVTEEGRTFYDRHVRRRRRARTGWTQTQVAAGPAAPAEEAGDRTVRAKLLRNAVEALRRVIPEDEEMEVGDLSARAGDAMAALLELAGRIERGEDPRRISRSTRP